MTTSTKALEARIESLEGSLKDLQAKIDSLPKPRDRGPTSTRTMTDDDAEVVCYGALKDSSHKLAAKDLGLSYAQVYSARGEYTFKHIHKAHEAK